MDILDIVNGFIEDREEKNTNLDGKRKNDLPSNTDSNKVDRIKISLIAEKLNNNVPNAYVAREFNVHVDSLKNILIDAGYRYDPLFYLWTKENEEKLIKNVVKELNNGIALNDLSKKYRKNKKNQLMFIENLRLKIESLGLIFDQKNKKWITKEEINREDKNNNISLINPQKMTNSNNYKPATPSKNKISCNDIIEKLNHGSSITKLEEETGLHVTQLRMIIQSEGYKYDSLFKKWINVDRKELLEKIAKDIYYSKSSIDIMAKTYGINRYELKQHLKMLGYDFKDDGINDKKQNGVKEGTTHNISKALPKVEEKFNLNSKRIKKLDSALEWSLNEEEYQLLKEILIDKKKQNKEHSVGKKSVKIYLSSDLFERIEDFSEYHDMTKSTLIENALDIYLSIWNQKNEQQEILENGQKSNNNYDSKNVCSTDCNEIELDLMLKNQQIGLDLNVWNTTKADYLFNAILDGTREGRTLNSIVEDVSKEIGINPSKCQSYWYSHAPKSYKDEFKKIKKEQEINWSNEDVKLLEYIMNVEFEHLTPIESLPIASERLKRHIDVVRKKWFQLRKDVLK